MNDYRHFFESDLGTRGLSLAKMKKWSIMLQSKHTWHFDIKQTKLGLEYESYTWRRKKENRSMTSFELEKYLRKRQMSYYLDYCCIEKINFSSRYDTVIILILSKTTHHDDNFTCRLVQIFLIFIINLSFPYNMDNNLLCRG